MRLQLTLLILLLSLAALAQTATTVPAEGGTFTGHLVPGSMQVFVVEGAPGQELWVYFRSSEKSANFEITDPDGNLAGSGRLDPYGYRKLLLKPLRAGTYTVVLTAEREANFEVTIQARK